MSSHIDTQERNLKAQLKLNRQMKKLKGFLTRFIAEEMPVEGKLVPESKKILKQTVEDFLEEAWGEAEKIVSGPKSLASSVPQLNFSLDPNALSPDRAAKQTPDTISNRTTKTRSRRSNSGYEFKRLSSPPSSPLLSSSHHSSDKQSIYSQFNSSLMSRSQLEALSMSGFCSVKGAATFGGSQRKLTQEHKLSPGPSAYSGDRLTLKKKSSRTVFSRGTPKKYYELGTKTPGPAAYYPIPELTSKRL